MRRIFGLLLVIALLASGCGSSKPRVNAVATVDGIAISRSDYQRYVSYAVSFYHSEAGTGPGSRTCNAHSARCHLLQQQVLRRLLEETVVLKYARSHQISLSPAERRQVAGELTTVATPGTPAATLLQQKVISPQFLRRLLENQVLVQKVEKHVLAGRGRRGPSYHIRIFAIPRGAGVNDAAVRRQALDLATDGQPVPPSASERVEWVASFRLSQHIRAAVDLAQPGEYTGPFRRKRAYLVVQLLGRGIHAYGRPAREALQVKTFRAWIDLTLRKSHPACQNQRGRAMPCPGPND